jgi:hypothetical protein
MPPIGRALLAFVAHFFRSRVSLQLEIAALRHQLTPCQRSSRRPRACPSDRTLWAWLARQWARCREVLLFGQPATAISLQRTRFRNHRARLRRRHLGRPAIDQEVRTLTRDISATTPRRGSPRILVAVRKLGSAVAKSTL